MALQQEKLWVERFEGSGYVTWQLRLRIALIERDLWKIVDGSEKNATAILIQEETRSNAGLDDGSLGESAYHTRGAKTGDQRECFYCNKGKKKPIPRKRTLSR